MRIYTFILLILLSLSSSGYVYLTPATTGGSGSHNLLSSTHSDTTTASGISGDVLRFNGTWERLGIGTAGQCLIVVTGLPAWGSCSGSSGAPIDAEYWVSTTNATLTNERNLGLLTTGLVLNTVTTGVGVPSAYGGADCTGLGLVLGLNSDGTPACNLVNLASTTFVGGILPLANGGTNQNGWTAARCVRVNAGGTGLEAAAGDCTTGSGLTSLNSQTGSSQTFVNDTNITIVSAANVHTVSWDGLLSVARGGTGLSTLTGLALGNGTSAMSAYGGTTCTNQFVRSLNLNGVATCQSIVAADITTGVISPTLATTALKSFSKSVTITDPTTAVANKIQWEFPLAITLTEIVCSTDIGTVTIQLDERTRGSPNTAGTNTLTSSLVCDATSEASTTFTNAGIAADVPLNLQITAVASTPTVVRIHLQYTLD